MNPPTDDLSHSTGLRPAPSLVTAIERARSWLDRVPYSVLALPLRLAVATVFWNSGTEKLADWNATLQLFHDEYKVPLLPPDFAAHLAASIELSTPVLLVLGFLTRPAALVLLGMTTVIEVFVYPQAWPTHIQWAAMLLVLLCRGAGTLSIDHWLRRRFG
ncbi:MAG TPA: DoxX family protein [Steroidobacteraceae bacterium]|nr:DoxX family protein [Steroidobacteraceae bacterium]